VIDINTDVMNKVYLHRAYSYAESKSIDPSTQNAAILLHQNPNIGVLVQAANGIPEGVKIPNGMWDGPDKYLYVEHAERNVIYKAANRGVITEGLTMYCPWICCADCARAIIQSGIKKVIGHQDLVDRTPERWKKSVDVGVDMLRDAGIQVGFWKGNVCGGRVNIRFNKEMISP
tara:strand:- start:1377 stop:1898 length:522 start_codon:yes stop_codon:yes gene_type:complete